MEFVAIDLNGTWLKVKEIRFEKSDDNSVESFHDCYVTFLDGKTERYDAQDVTVLNEEDYSEDELIS